MKYLKYFLFLVLLLVTQTVTGATVSSLFTNDGSSIHPISSGYSGFKIFSDGTTTGGSTTTGSGSFYEAQKWSGTVHILESGGWGSDVGVQEPAVFYFNSLFRMLYAGMSTNTGKTYIGYADSPDGTNWTSLPSQVIGNGHGGAPGEAFHHFVYNPGGSTLYCYYCTNTGYTLYATSTDGSNWTTGGIAYTNQWVMANTCVVSNDADGLYYMAVEYHLGATNWISGMATSSVPTGPFTDLRSFDPTLDPGLGSYSVGSIYKVNGVWQNYYHVQPLKGQLPSSIIRAYTSNTHLTNWTIAPISPIFVVSSNTTHGYKADQVADVKAIIQTSNNSLLLFHDVVVNSPIVVGSIVLNSYNGTLSQVIADGNILVPRAITVSLSAGFVAPNNTATNLIFDQVDANNGMLYNNGTGEFLVTMPGVYKFNATGNFSDNLAGGAQQLRVLTNGVIRYLNSWPGAGGSMAMLVDGTFRAVQGDKINFAIFQNSGTSHTVGGISGGILSTYAEVQLVGP